MIFSNIIWNSWPELKGWRYEIKPETTDSRLEWFARQDYDTMDQAVKDLETLLSGMKEIRKNKLDKEIAETEERLKNLKSQE